MLNKLIKNKHLKPYLIIAISLSLFFIMIYSLSSDYFINNTGDILMNLVGGKVKKPSKDIVLLFIDEPAIKYIEKTGLGRWPWPRKIYPEILRFIYKADPPPKAVFFDILFSESDQEKGNDAYFAGDIAYYKTVYHNALPRFNASRSNRVPLPPDVVKNFTIKVKNADKIKYKFGDYKEYTMPIPILRSAISPTNKSAKALANALPIAGGIEIAQVKSDNDGIYRKGKILFKYGNHFLPSFSLAAMMAYTGDKTPEVINSKTIKVGKYKIPIDKNGKYRINYHKTRFETLSISHLFDSAYYHMQGDVDKMKIKPSAFSDKIVIIGVSFVGGGDLKNSPLSQTMPGPEIHANLISNILTKNHLKIENFVFTCILVVLITFLTMGIIVLIKSNLYKIIYIFSGVILYIGLETLFFSVTNHLSPIIFGMSVGLISLIAGYIFLSMTEGAEKRKFSKILGNMVDPSIVTQALDDLEALKAGGEKNITAFFSDIASFSTISEKLSSKDLAALLNEYLSAMTDILMHYNGTLDKYIGDAIVGIFGAPMDLSDNANKAAEASIDMMTKIVELRKIWTDDNRYCVEAQQMQFRIGLNTGIAKVGFMGTDKLAAYTMMGDTVNLAARLESAGKDYGVHILISEHTKAKLYDRFVTRKLDLVRVKGKNKPVLIYELIGRKGEVEDNIIEARDFYEEGFEMYQSRKWKKALELFKNAEKKLKNRDKSVEMLKNRVILYSRKAPPADWDGVFTRTHK